MSEYKEKTVIITGGAAGIGYAIAKAFLAEKANVIIADNNYQSLERAEKELPCSGGRLITSLCDVSKRNDLFDVVRKAIHETGRIDIMINNAGITMGPNNIEDLSPEFIEHMLGINLNGVIWGTQAALKELKKSDGGVILNIASISAVRPRPGRSIYTASKLAVIGITKSVSLEAASHGIRCLVINPVASDTDMLNDLIGDDNDYLKERNKILDTIPAGRLCQPDDVAKAALFLCSSDAKMITGSCIDVDGGRGV
ncbi:SDR family oxidoreductase [Halomonas aquamarina]|uniref:SDR family NAD(P)-dependent oxidoreductase n=1 Tax=Vreelandella aquamarina TaxID=77097 RepID=UPI002358D05A|nr:SDR family oxidoreductase [Halomonas aquamarina]MDC8442664.1 SDR family oxidoreductase [Halomonas aquamarina]